MIDPDAAQPERSERSNLDRGDSRQAAELLPRVLEALPLGVAIFELGAEGFRFRYGNRGFARVLALERMPSAGQPVGEVFDRADQDAVVELFRLVRVSREPQSYFAAEGRRGPSADRIWNIDAYPLLSAGRVSHVLILAERTEGKLEARQRQQLEANRLRKKADHLAELEKAKSEFLRLASHELRGPAATLGGYLSLIEDESLGPIPERLRPVLPMLKAKAAQINLLANEMVEAARLEDGRVELKREPVDLREIVQESVAAAETTATPLHRIGFDDRVGREVWILGDLMRLEIIIGNLLDNAVKYSPEGGEVSARLSVSGDVAMLSVRDQGIGIAAPDLDRLFVRFSRLSTLSDVPGTGLGLYLARELAQLHGGDISAASKPGEGSEFILNVPVDRATDS
jgi:signal transduction histidine kinase